MDVQIVSFHCVLKNKLGKILSSTYNREVMTHNESQPQTLAGLAKGLRNLKQGEKRKILLTAAEAYGFYDRSKVREVPKRHLKGELKVGQQVVFRNPEQNAQVYTITHIGGETVVIDSNHPLAGQDLIFEIEATEVRDATPEDIRDSMVVVPGELLH